MKWLNEPREWNAEGRNLSLMTEDKTDFWQMTFYGWRNDNGHFYYREVEGDFTAEVAFSADYRAQYDQAGLMLRHGPTQWIKAGVEFAHGRAVVSAVYTQELSDWAIGPEVPVSGRLHLRFTRKGNAFCVQWREAGKFQTLRLGAFSGKGAAMVGPMACSPVEGGLKVRFEDFTIGPAIDFAAEV
jgi:uncharacterized protein